MQERRTGSAPFPQLPPRPPAWRGWNPGAPDKGRSPGARRPWRRVLQNSPKAPWLPGPHCGCARVRVQRQRPRRPQAAGVALFPRAFSDHAHFDVCVIQSEKKPFTSPSLSLHEAKKRVIVPFSSEQVVKGFRVHTSVLGFGH